MSKRYCIFLSALFCAFLGLFLAANALAPDREKSEVENRVLAQMPELQVGRFDPSGPLRGEPLFQGGNLFSGEFMRDFETYVTDQFVARDAWVSLKSATERALGKQENNGVYFGSQGTLISRFDPPDPEKVANNLSYVNKFVDNVEIPVYFSLIPTQACIWSGRLPEGAPNASQTDLLEQAQSATAARWYDTYSQLWDHREEDIFYRTDHHWTSLGAYYGYVALAQAMGLEPVPLSQYTKTTVSREFYGTVFSSSGVRWIRPDAIDTYVPETGVTVVSHTYDQKGNPVEEPRQLYDESYLQVKDKYAMFLGGQQPLGVVTTQNSSAPKLLLIRDSYTDSLVPFLTAHFSEIHLIDLRYYKLSAADYIRKNGIAAAVVLYSVPNFASDSNLVWLGR